MKAWRARRSRVTASYVLLPVGNRVPFDEGVHVRVDGHHDNDDVEGVEQPDVNHLQTIVTNHYYVIYKLLV